MTRRDAVSRGQMAAEYWQLASDSRRGRQARKQGSRKSSTRGFQLREETEGNAGRASMEDAVHALSLAFDGAFPRSSVEAALVASSGDADRAAEYLLSDAGRGGEAGVPPQDCAIEAASKRGEPSRRAGSSTAPSLWARLPEELKRVVFARLSIRDLARAASVSAEFAALSRARARRETQVKLPPGLSMRVVSSAVAAFQNAPQILLLRGWEATLATPEAWEGLALAIARGEQARCGRWR